MTENDIDDLVDELVEAKAVSKTYLREIATLHLKLRQRDREIARLLDIIDDCAQDESGE